MLPPESGVPSGAPHAPLHLPTAARSVRFVLVLCSIGREKAQAGEHHLDLLMTVFPGIKGYSSRQFSDMFPDSSRPAANSSTVARYEFPDSEAGGPVLKLGQDG